MDAFGHLSVFISIILGLGITQILTGLGRLVQARGRVRWYWPTVMWSVVLLLIHVQTWWVMFGLRDAREWTFGGFLLILLQPGLLYLMSALVLPDPGADHVVDLAANYHAQARWFFGLAVLLLVQSLARDLVRDGALPERLNVAAHLVFGALWSGAAFVRREGYHRFAAVATAVLFAAYVSALFARLR